jgi:C4-dicarboxylate-specific signal transduction histidine kinase
MTDSDRAPAGQAVLDDAMPDDAVLLRQRLRIALLLCLAPIVGFALFDLYLADPEKLPVFYALKLIAVALALGAFAYLHPPRSHAVVVGVGLVCIAIFYVLSTASAILAREPLTTPILSVAFALGTATLLPWGMAAQAAAVAIAVLATVATVYGSTGGLAALLQYPNVGLALGLGLSVYVAREFDHSRRLLRRRHADQARAEADVRRLNEVLEARVAERTAELQASKASLSALIENTGDAIWSIDRNYRIIALNSVTAERFRAFVGVPLNAGMAYDERTTASFAASFGAEWKAHYDRGLTGERFSIEHALPLPGGTRHYHTSFNPIVSGGEVTGLAMFSTDITDRLRAEADARQHQAELTHVLRLSTMGEMAAGLAHEINQPLAAIVNYAQGCLRRLRSHPSDVEAVLPVIDDIAAEGMRAAEIIRRLRSMVRKEPPRQDWMDLGEVVADAVRLIGPEARDHGVLLHVQTATPTPTVMGDRIQIEQVVLNLLRNGIEALAEVHGRRELTIGVRSTDGERVELTVSDTGPGMSAAVAERAFDAFFSTKAAGLGMGLSISRTIIEAHQGRLWATSGPGGTTFHATLPLAAPVTLASAAV